MPCKCPSRHPPPLPHFYTFHFRLSVSTSIFWQPCYPVSFGNVASGGLKIGTLFDDKLFYYIEDDHPTECILHLPPCRSHRCRCDLRELLRERIRSAKTFPSARTVSGKEKPERGIIFRLILNRKNKILFSKAYKNNKCLNNFYTFAKNSLGIC
jgi:hypothetical protein